MAHGRWEQLPCDVKGTMAIDYNPLFENVSKEQLDTFRRQERAAGGMLGVAPLLLGLIAGGVFLFFTVVSIAAEVQGHARLDRIAIMIAIALAVAVGGYFAIRTLRRIAALRRYRITTFAVRNGLLYSSSPVTPQYPGSIFFTGNSRNVYQRLWREDASPLEIGNYRFTTGSGKNRRTHYWSFLSIRLPRRLPHMLLDAKGNNSLFGSNLPVTFDRKQRLSLEGNFDEHFTLYCPREYETDALYVFTPDLMALLIDEAATLDVEIVDDWMFVYANKTLDFTSPHQLARLFRIVDTVGKKTKSRSSRYADDRVLGDSLAAASAGHGADQLGVARSFAEGTGTPERLSHNLIAPKGQRLSRGTPWLVFAIVAAAMIVWFAARVLTGSG